MWNEKFPDDQVVFSENSTFTTRSPRQDIPAGGFNNCWSYLVA